MATKRKQSADWIAAKRVLDAESGRRRHPAQATRLDDRRIDVPAIGSDRAEAVRKTFGWAAEGLMLLASPAISAGLHRHPVVEGTSPPAAAV